MTTTKLPPLEDILELMARGENYTQIGARYGVTNDAVSTAIKRARQRGELPPLEHAPKPDTTPTRRSTSTARAVNDLTITPRSLNPRGPQGDRHLPPPAAPGQPACGARQLLGTRVCDLAPHGDTVGHVGAGAGDARGEFWGRR